MGREIRMVPPNWEHPTTERIQFRPGRGLAVDVVKKPMYDRDFSAAAEEWKQEYAKWERGEFPDYSTPESREGLEFWEYHGDPPDRAYYRPWKDEEATWFQVWETVSEGTPVTPPFATREELIDYLVENGGEWDQNRYAEGGPKPGWSRQNAEAFVNAGWAPTLTTVTDEAGMRVFSPRDGVPA